MTLRCRGQGKFLIRKGISTPVLGSVGGVFVMGKTVTIVGSLLAEVAQRTMTLGLSFRPS